MRLVHILAIIIMSISCASKNRNKGYKEPYPRSGRQDQRDRGDERDSNGNGGGIEDREKKFREAFSKFTLEHEDFTKKTSTLGPKVMQVEINLSKDILEVLPNDYSVNSDGDTLSIYKLIELAKLDGERFVIKLKEGISWVSSYRYNDLQEELIKIGSHLYGEDTANKINTISEIRKLAPTWEINPNNHKADIKAFIKAAEEYIKNSKTVKFNISGGYLPSIAYEITQTHITVDNKYSRDFLKIGDNLFGKGREIFEHSKIWVDDVSLNKLKEEYLEKLGSVLYGYSSITYLDNLFLVRTAELSKVSTREGYSTQFVNLNQHSFEDLLDIGDELFGSKRLKDIKFEKEIVSSLREALMRLNSSDPKLEEAREILRKFSRNLIEKSSFSGDRQTAVEIIGHANRTYNKRIYKKDIPIPIY